MDPEVTISPADNGYIVKHYQRSTKKDEPGRTIQRIASSVPQALGHAGSVLGGAGKQPRKRTSRGTQLGQADVSVGSAAIPGSGAMAGGPGRTSMRRRRPRVGGRR